MKIGNLGDMSMLRMALTSSHDHSQTCCWQPGRSMFTNLRRYLLTSRYAGLDSETTDGSAVFSARAMCMASCQKLIRGSHEEPVKHVTRGGVYSAITGVTVSIFSLLLHRDQPWSKRVQSRQIHELLPVFTRVVRAVGVTDFPFDFY